MLAWAYTIHKSQGKTLSKVVIDLGNSEKCCGMTVALSRVRRLEYLSLHPFSFEGLKRINYSRNLPLIQDSSQKLSTKFHQTRKPHQHLWQNNH